MTTPQLYPFTMLDCNKQAMRHEMTINEFNSINCPEDKNSRLNIFHDCIKHKQGLETSHTNIR